jgi:hypothetical protein
MMKATTQTFWADQDAQMENRTSAVLFGKWFNKAKQSLRHLLLQDVLQNELQNVSQSNGAPNKNKFGFWAILIVRQKQKFSAAERGIKEEFFYGNEYAGRKNIPNKTWRRHSAFLVYGQKLDNLHTKQATQVSRQSGSIAKQSDATARIIFQVKSIKPLPTWATVLNDMSLIENDMSSLRFMEIRALSHVTSEAA